MSTASLVGVTKHFASRTVLDGVTFDFEPATRYVIRGDSGAGKSTLLNLLAGYIQPDGGTVRAAAPVGYLFQDELLMGNLSVRQNLMVRLAGLRAPAEHWERATLEVTSRVGIDHLVDEMVSSLSGGERQRVELAGLLLADPKLVLMDEPTSRLDAANQRAVADAVDDLFGDRTVVVVTHASDTPLADGAASLRLDGGHLVEA